NAPLAGAFYAFELIIGSYTPATLLPVIIAAVSGTLIARSTFGTVPVFELTQQFTPAGRDFAMAAIIGAASAGLAILAMRGVTWVEAACRHLQLPRWLRPGLGGLVLGLIALGCPQVLGSGHGGIVQILNKGYTLPLLAAMVLAKMAGSAVSVGS